MSTAHEQSVFSSPGQDQGDGPRAEPSGPRGREGAARAAGPGGYDGQGDERGSPAVAAACLAGWRVSRGGGGTGFRGAWRVGCDGRHRADHPADRVTG